MPEYLLSIDDGGTYIKAALFDKKGAQLAITKHYNKVISNRPGETEYDQNALWETNCLCIKEVIGESGVDPRSIACVGISAQGCGFYAIDRDGRNIRNAISSSDARAARYADKWLSDGAASAAFPLIYRNTSAGHLNAILAWLKDNEPGNYAKIARLFSMKDLLIYRLTGEIVAGYGCLSASGLMNLQTNEFDPRLAEIFGVSEMSDKLGRLVWDDEICGRVSARASSQTGLAKGTPVAAGHHDVVASAIAMGVTTPDPLFMITGTHGINGYVSPTPILNGSIRYNELFAFPGLYLIEEGYPASSATLEWVIDALFDREASAPGEIYRRINEMVVDKGETDSPLVFLPHLRGNRDNVAARGAWIGLSPTHTRSQMLLAVYEGVVFSHMMQAEHLLANRPRPEAVRMAGGATGSRVWMQLFSDALQLPLDIVPGAEMGARGAAISAAAAVGLYPDIASAVSEMSVPTERVRPDPRKAEELNEKYIRYRHTVETLDGLWKLY